MRYALVDDQPGRRGGHRLPQKRLLARQPVPQIAEGVHIGRQRNLREICRRDVTKLSQKYKPDHVTSSQVRMISQLA
jgi:hypothetical protein